MWFHSAGIRRKGWVDSTSTNLIAFRYPQSAKKLIRVCGGSSQTSVIKSSLDEKPKWEVKSMVASMPCGKGWNIFWVKKEEILMPFSKWGKFSPSGSTSNNEHLIESTVGTRYCTSTNKMSNESLDWLVISGQMIKKLSAVSRSWIVCHAVGAPA